MTLAGPETGGVSADGRAADGERVLILAPFRRDAELLRLVLAADGFAALPCAGAEEFARRLDGCALATVVLSQEALSPVALEALRRHLDAQPPWSELPGVLLLDGDQHNDQALARLQALLPRAKLILLHRPVRRTELLAAVRVAADSRRRQIQVRDHMALQEELRRELNHRVKNVLANVFAMYRLTCRQSASLGAFTEAFEGRFAALSRVHGALIASGSRPQGLRGLAELTLGPYRSAGGAVAEEHVALDGPDLLLRPHAAVILALALHELATNAAKYGALSAPEGTLFLRWTLDPGPPNGGLVRIRWREAGGPPVRPPERRGYGTAFIASIVRHGWRGGAEFDFRPEGLVCEITGAADAILAGAGAPPAKPGPQPVNHRLSLVEPSAE